MARTRKQLLDLTATLPACTAQVIYSFADGWTVRRLLTRGDEHREGMLAGHCWHHNDAIDPARAWAGDIDDYFHTPLDEEDPYNNGDRTKCYSLRDPDNIPRVSFYLDEETVWQKGWAKSGRLHLNEALGHHSSDPKPEYLERLIAWVETLEPAVVFSARYFTGSQQRGSVELINERDWREQSGEGGLGDMELENVQGPEDLNAALEQWAAQARPGEIRVIGGLLV